MRPADQRLRSGLPLLVVALLVAAVPSAPPTEPPDVVLVGFGPFTGFPTNPAESLVAEEARRRPGWGSRVLPVDPRGALEALYPLLESGTSTVIGVGVRAGIERIQLNSTALNWMSLRDLSDWLHFGPLDPSLPTEISLRDPELERLKREVAVGGLDVDVTRDAGVHVCNLVLFHGLLHAPPGVRFAFVHVPPEILEDPALRTTFSALIDLLAAPIPEAP